MVLACLSALSGRDAPLSLLPPGMGAMVPQLAGLAAFGALCLWFCRAQYRPHGR